MKILATFKNQINFIELMASNMDFANFKMNNNPLQKEQFTSKQQNQELLSIGCVISFPVYVTLWITTLCNICYIVDFQ